MLLNRHGVEKGNCGGGPAGSTGIPGPEGRGAGHEMLPWVPRFRERLAGVHSGGYCRALRVSAGTNDWKSSGRNTPDQPAVRAAGEKPRQRPPNGCGKKQTGPRPGAAGVWRKRRPDSRPTTAAVWDSFRAPIRPWPCQVCPGTGAHTPFRGARLTAKRCWGLRCQAFCGSRARHRRRCPRNLGTAMKARSTRSESMAGISAGWFGIVGKAQGDRQSRRHQGRHDPRVGQQAAAELSALDRVLGYQQQ